MSKLINKILLLMSFFLIIFILAFNLCFGFLFMNHSQKVEEIRLESTALSLADTIGKVTGSNNLTNPYNSNVLQLINLLNQGEIWLVDKTSLNIAGYKNKLPLKYNQLSQQAVSDIQKVLDGNIVHTGAFANYTKADYLTIGVPVYSNGQIIGALLFSSNLPDINYSWYDGIAIMSSLSILLLVILLYLLKLIINKEILPLSALNNFIDKILQHDYSGHLKVKAKDEISSLADKLNQLSIYLKNTEEKTTITAQNNSDLVLQTAYKIHSPLKEVKNILQKLETKPSSFNEEMLKKLKRDIHQIDSITNNLLNESKYSIKHIKIKKDLLNLTELIDEAITARENFALDKQIKFAVNNQLSQKILLFTGDKNRLKQMLCEIFDKLLNSYPMKSSINVDILENDAYFNIKIYNVNTEITSEQISSFFPQFYENPDKNLLTNSLELKIAEHIAKLHNIKFEINTEKDAYPTIKLSINK